MARTLLLTVTLALLSGCSGSTSVSVENRSGLLLQSIVLSGGGFEQSIGDLAPGATVKIQVNPSGESGLGISFSANGKDISLPPSGYFEGGGRYSVTVVVTPELTASVDSHLRLYQAMANSSFKPHRCGARVPALR